MAFESADSNHSGVNAGNDLQSPLLGTSQSKRDVKPFKHTFLQESKIRLSIAETMADNSWQTVPPFNLVTITRTTNTIIFVTMWSTWLFAILWSYQEHNITTLLCDRMPTLLSLFNNSIEDYNYNIDIYKYYKNSQCNIVASDLINNKNGSYININNLYNHKQIFNANEAYITLRARFEFYNDSRTNTI